ncbi:response regulator transcription factor [Granulosicoccaceae sp. 1_MG-2023]|nr:response regulator transcription factor [Granulosicoccaceae sp. 1_MG-2023]
MLRTLLVEDDTDLAQTLIDYLAFDDISCDYASNGVAGLALLQQNRYDVILLDLNLPRLDGISVCSRLREQGNNTPVLMLTARDTLDNKAEGFRAGTDDYLVKPFEPAELVMRIQALSRRRSLQGNRLQFEDIEMNTDTRTVTRAGQTIRLTPAGWRLLETLLRAAPDPVPRAGLIQAVWGDDAPDSNALKVHIHHLRKAIDGPFDTALLQTIPGLGFALATTDPHG